MTIKGNGRVGIRNTNPQATLDVNGSMNISGDFVNQAVYQVNPISGAPWHPPSSATGTYVDFPGASLTFNVPLGSRVFIAFNASGWIDSDTIHLDLYRDNNLIYSVLQDCYLTAGSRRGWNFNFSQLDVNVTPGGHTYKVKVRHSDDAEDCTWTNGPYSTFQAIIIKE